MSSRWILQPTMTLPIMEAEHMAETETFKEYVDIHYNSQSAIKLANII